MGNSNKSSLRKSQSVPDTQKLTLDAPVFDKQKSVSHQRLNDKPGKLAKGGKKHKQPTEDVLQLPPTEAAFLPEFPLRGDLEELDFQILDVIARGAYGNVIKVQREDEKKFYAVKVLDKAQIIEEGAIRQCKDEATIQSMAGEHPLVVKAHEYWQSRRSLYIVLDYIPHGDMFTLWTFHGAFPEDLVQLYIAEMAMVIDFLHNASVIYRDIKMENILFNALGHIQLTDFGLAKWLKGGEQTRTVCGTLQYMAPEVLSVYPYSHSADWWSLGILMFAMLAGRYPVDGADTHTKMAQKVFDCDFLLPSHISDAAQDVINRLLTKSPHKRLCEVDSLQDLDFFQGIFFPDLIEQKLNPVDVVAEDFFPMSGQSWAPPLLTEEEQRNFDEFDDSSDTFVDDQGFSKYPDYCTQPQAFRHHPDPVHRQQPSQAKNKQQWGAFGGRFLHGEMEPTAGLHEQSFGHQASRLGHSLKKSCPDLRRASLSRDSDLSDTSDSSVVAGTRPAPSHNASRSGIEQSSTPQPGYESSSGSSYHNSVDGRDRDRKIVINQKDDIAARSSSVSDRRSYGGKTNDQNIICNAGAAGRANEGPEVMPTSRFIPVIEANRNSVSRSREGSNRCSGGPEFKSVEAPPTITLKTPTSGSPLLPRYNHLQAAVGVPAPSGYPGMNKEPAKVHLQHKELNYKDFNSQATLQSAGKNVAEHYKPANQGYKTFEAPPVLTLPSSQVNLVQNSATHQNKDSKQPQSAAGGFPVHASFSSVSSPNTNTNFQRLDQTGVTLNNAPQITKASQRPAVPTKPIPAQKPSVASQPLRPVPAPRHSLRLKKQNFSHLNTQAPDSASSIQNSANSIFDKEHSHASASSQNVPLHSQSKDINNDSLNNQWHCKNTTQPQPATAVGSRPRLGGTGSLVPGSVFSELYDASKSSDSQNFQWNLPAGTQPQPETSDEGRPRLGGTGSLVPGSVFSELYGASKSSDSQNFQWNLPAGTTPSFI